MTGTRRWAQPAVVVLVAVALSAVATPVPVAAASRPLACSVRGRVRGGDPHRDVRRYDEADLAAQRRARRTDADLADDRVVSDAFELRAGSGPGRAAGPRTLP